LLIEMNKNPANNDGIKEVMDKEGFVDIGHTNTPGVTSDGKTGWLDQIFVNPKFFAARGIAVPTGLDLPAVNRNTKSVLMEVGSMASFQSKLPLALTAGSSSAAQLSERRIRAQAIRARAKTQRRGIKQQRQGMASAPSPTAPIHSTGNPLVAALNLVNLAHSASAFEKAFGLASLLCCLAFIWDRARSCAVANHSKNGQAHFVPGEAAVGEGRAS